MKPILFNTEMVRAILDNRKTVTRRVVKFRSGFNPTWTGYVPDGAVLYGSNNIPAAKAPYHPGDILYVRETWTRDGDVYRYKAGFYDQNRKWKPSIHMPREAARIFLRVTNVRVERLQDITGEDAEKEGCNDYTSTACGFADVWDRTIKPVDRAIYGWEANPWVWVIEFERCEKPKEEK